MQSHLIFSFLLQLQLRVNEPSANGGTTRLGSPLPNKGDNSFVNVPVLPPLAAFISSVFDTFDGAFALGIPFVNTPIFGLLKLIFYHHLVVLLPYFTARNNSSGGAGIPPKPPKLPSPSLF